MSAAIEHACSIGQEPIVDVFHVLAGEEKDNYDSESNYQMKPFHRVLGLQSNSSLWLYPAAAPRKAAFVVRRRCR